jgi:hypothetical protein
MEVLTLLEIIGNGETTKVQFKSDVHNVISISQEMVAFSNTLEGLFITTETINIHGKRTAHRQGWSYLD